MNKTIKNTTIPDTYNRRQLNSLYREIPLKDTTSRQLRKYFKAMSNLYGAVTVDFAWKLIKDIHPSLVTEEEFIAFAIIAIHECEGYTVISESSAKTVFENEIVNVALLEGERYEAFMKLREEKPFFMPDKKTLLLYSEASYCANEAETEGLKSFIASHLKNAETEVDEVLLHVLTLEKMENMMYGDILSNLFANYIDVKDEKETSELTELLCAFHNTLALPCNGGYSPNELHKLYPAAEAPKAQSVSLGSNMRRMIESGQVDPDELRLQILEMKFPNENMRSSLLKELSMIAPAKSRLKLNTVSKPVNTKTVQTAKKVGRNDPCPCGSGKKYKKCCGR